MRCVAPTEKDEANHQLETGSKELYEKKSEMLFEHVYEAYVGESISVFNQAT